MGLAGAMMLGTCALLVEAMSIRIAPATIWDFAALSLPKIFAHYMNSYSPTFLSVVGSLAGAGYSCSDAKS